MNRLNEILTQNLMPEILHVDFHQVKQLFEDEHSDLEIAEVLQVNPLTVELIRDALN